MEKDRLKLGIKKYGYDSEFIREYNSLMLQLKYDEREKFFDKWKIKTKVKYKTVWDYMENISFTADDVINEVNDRNSAIELGWKLALSSYNR